MLYYLAQLLTPWFGPARLFASHLLLLAGGTSVAAALVFVLLPRLWNRLPTDRGKVLCKDMDGMVSKGKPTGAGFQVTLLALPVILLFAPLRFWDLVVVAFTYLAMLFGYLDDRAAVPWGELRKGLLDAVCALAIAYALAKGHGTLLWFPFTTAVWRAPLVLYVPCAAFLLWFTMNATNCSDGVDGLAGSLTVITLVILAVLLYAVVGYRPVAHYFLLPCDPEAARWGILVMTVAGAFGGYLWYNANPSQVLMGDAGSRFLGILVGAAVLVTGDPFLVFALAPVVLLNGGGGLGKLVILRLAKRAGLDIGDEALIRKIRFPLHDHCKKNLGWSNAQVLMRFVLIQLVVMPALLIIILKVR